MPGTILIVLLVLMLLGSPGNSFLRWRDDPFLVEH